MTSPIAAFDLDGTLLPFNSSFLFCRFLEKKSFLTKLDLLFCSRIYLKHKLGLCSLKELHTLVFARLFRNQPLSILLDYKKAFFYQTIKWYAPALQKLRALQQEGYSSVLCSSSPGFLVEGFAKRIGVSEVIATEYEIDKEGRLVEISRLVDGIEKKEALEKRFGGYEVAFSDSHLDLPFLEGACTPYAVRPTFRLRQIAKKRNWEIL
ncbi:MAG: putative hydrolase [Chlamydiae bacterium]|nr:putative hydrolase [Chlamydiota bacterium]